jgi:hypothetical protein
VAGRGLYDLQTGTRIDLPAGIPLDFSPDKTQLLYLVDQTTTSIQSAALISTADGSSQALHSTDYFLLAHRWEGNSPQLLSSALDLGSGVRLYELDGLTGTRRDVAQFTNSISGYTYANWSPDGQRLAVWIREGFGKTRRESPYRPAWHRVGDRGDHTRRSWPSGILSGRQLSRVLLLSRERHPELVPQVGHLRGCESSSPGVADPRKGGKKKTVRR